MACYTLRQAFKLAILCNVLLIARSGFFSSDDETVDTDSKGYVMFCPGMGGFDNQVEQFLGAVDFAKSLNRTLILPNWIEYHKTDRDADLVPFEKYFKVEVMNKYTKSITMDDFMKNIAAKVWPKGRRSIFCFTYRDETELCKAKEGNPYAPYWNKYKINFDKDIKFAPLSYDMADENNLDKWAKTYPAEKYPVLAFTSSPGDFPILKHNVHLQEHLEWSDTIEKKANDFIKSFKKNQDDIFLGLHIKNGIEHYRACEHASEFKQGNFFSSAQCLGYKLEYGELTNSLCYPTDHEILDQLEAAIKILSPKYVFVISEINDIVDRFKKVYEDIKFIKLDEENPHVELAVLGKADHAILNCVSLSSAFVKRQRDHEGKTSQFWSFKKKEIDRDDSKRTEL